MDEECGGVSSGGALPPRRRSSYEIGVQKVKGIYQTLLDWLRNKILTKREIGVENEFIYDEQLGKWRFKNEREEDIVRRQEEHAQSFAYLSTQNAAHMPAAPLPPPPTGGPVTTSGNRSNAPWVYTDWTTGETIAMGGDTNIVQGSAPHYAIPGQEPVIAPAPTSAGPGGFQQQQQQQQYQPEPSGHQIPQYQQQQYQQGQQQQQQYQQGQQQQQYPPTPAFPSNPAPSAAGFTASPLQTQPPYGGAAPIDMTQQQQTHGQQQQQHGDAGISMQQQANLIPMKQEPISNPFAARPAPRGNQPQQVLQSPFGGAA